MELKGKALDFYLGAMCGVLGNYVVSCIIEVANGTFENKSAMVLGFWGVMFILSSVSFFQVTKIVLKHYVSPKETLKPLDLVTIICVVLGVVVILFAILR